MNMPRSEGPRGSDVSGLIDIMSAGALTIEATSSVDWVVLANGLAWVSGLGEGIGQLDHSGRLIQSAELSGWCRATDSGFGMIWSATNSPPGLARIDVANASVRHRDLDEPVVDCEASVGAGEGAVWMTVGSTERTLLRIDPETLQTAARHAVPPGSGPVRAGLGAVWVVDVQEDQLIALDPMHGRSQSKTTLGRGARFLALGEGAVWVLNQLDGTVSRIDPATHSVVAVIELGGPVGGGDITVGGGSVWVRGGPNLLTRIDASTNHVVERYGPVAGSGGVAADNAAVWLTAHDIATIWRLPLA